METENHFDPRGGAWKSEPVPSRQPTLTDTLQNGHNYMADLEDVAREIMSRLRGPRPEAIAQKTAEPSTVIGSAEHLTTRTASLLGDLRSILNLLA